MIDTLKRGQIVGIFPNEAEFFLNHGQPEAGRFLEFVGRHGFIALPVAECHDEERKMFYVHFAKPMICKNDPEDPNSWQTSIDLVMEQIAQFLPSPMQGVYAKKKK